MAAMRFEGLNSSLAMLELGKPLLLEHSLTPPSTSQEGSLWQLERVGEGYVILRAGGELLEFRLEEGRTRMVFSHKLKPGERVLGFGEKYARLNRRHKRFNMWNVDQTHHLPSGDPTYASTPTYILCSKDRRLGVAFDYAGYIWFDVDSSGRGELSATVEGGGLRIYLAWGETLTQVVRTLYALFGGYTLPPKWALGYHQCRYSYMSQQEVLEVASKFREKGIPCDAVWLDIDHMEGYADFTWDPRRFPEPAKMISQLHALGFRLVTIVDVGIPQRRGYEPYEVLEEVDGFLKTSSGERFVGVVWPGPCVFPDFARREVRERWARLVSKWLAQGVDGIWLDMNEPSIFLLVNRANEAAKNLCSQPEAEGWVRLSSLPRLNTVGLEKFERYVPLDVTHTLEGGVKVDHSEIHNAYPLLEAWATREGFRALDVDRRWFILSRAGYTGIQRYAALWTGDNQADWGQLEISIPQLLSLSLCGVPFVGADVGGFFDDADPELLVRWTQLGAFYPFFRNHSSKLSNRREPWAFGQEYEEKIAKAIGLRYRFLPYLYSVFWEGSLVGEPVMRPLAYEFPEDERAWDVDTEFMVGPSLLVAPVTQPGARARAVYLPAGAGWLDYWTRKTYRGGGWVCVEAPLERIPLFVREGSAIAVSDGPYTNAQSWRPAVEAYVEEKARGTLYDDDGESLGYTRGAYCAHEFLFECVGDKLVLKHRALAQGYTPPYREVEVRVLNGEPLVELEGSGRTFDLRTQRLFVKL